MVDTNPEIDIEIRSTASSDISESLREQILGKGYSKTKYRKPTSKPINSDELLSTFEIVETPGIRASRDSKKSYHTAVGSKENTPDENGFVIIPSSSGNRKPASFQMVPNKPNSAHSMKTPENRKYTTIETQTIAIQTVATGTDPGSIAEGSWGDHDCNCCECEKEKYYSNSKNFCPSETSEQSVCCEEISTPRYGGCYCKHCSCKCRDWDYESSATEPPSDSDDSFSTDFLDLPYQNNEEYLKLLKELEKKLLARNKERVRKTMMEFERRSRQNQNLEKPICEYNCDDTASMLRKLTARAKKSPCCKCGKKKVNSDILQNEKKWEKKNYVQTICKDDIEPSPNRIERSLHKSHWQLDPRSGEWVKISCFHQQSDFSRPPNGDEYAKGPTSNLGKRECCCRQKKRH